MTKKQYDELFPSLGRLDELDDNKNTQKTEIELGEIREIVASANMGIWCIELVENEKPRMYANETMKKLLGIGEKQQSPEQTYLDWFSNINPDSVPSVLASVDRMKRGFNDENTYLWQHPSKGLRYVRCGGIAKAIPGGYSLQGYHYDVDEVVRKEQAQMLILQKALEDKKEYYEILDTLGDIFYSLHLIDLTEDSVVAFNSQNEIKAIVNHKFGSAEMMAQVMKNNVAEEYKELALEFSDLSTIAERMCNKKLLSCQLRGIHIGWFIVSFITVAADAAGRPTKLLFACRIIDEEKKREEKLWRKAQTDEMTGLLNRRAYEEKIYEQNDIPTEEHFTYVSIDANGLKEINDTKGHSAGDEMLIGLADCMKSSLGPYGQLFRIGGDEFVVILFCEEEKLKHIFKGFDEAVAGWTGKLNTGLSISYGWINKNEKPEASVRELGAIAEKRMYAAKAAYYQRLGVDRRGQHDAHKALCASYTKILKINITHNTYQIINMDMSEKTVACGFANSLAEWLTNFGLTGGIHPEDLEEYLRLTNLEFIKTYFDSGKTALHIFYRRKYAESYKRTMVEIIPANDYSTNNQSMFLYVKNIDL